MRRNLSSCRFIFRQLIFSLIENLWYEKYPDTKNPQGQNLTGLRLVKKP